jgi:hypothetical protein
MSGFAAVKGKSEKKETVLSKRAAFLLQRV